jgi:hypothetical protein
MIKQEDEAGITWRVSSRSTGGNQCVEVGAVPGGGVAIRDSKNRSQAAHVISRQAWATFIAVVKNGQL